MPNIKSAKKRVKIIERNTLRNVSQKSALRTAIRDVREAVLANDLKLALANLAVAFSKIDKATGKVIHKNAAARLKSRLNIRIKSIESSTQKQK